MTHRAVPCGCEGRKLLVPVADSASPIAMTLIRMALLRLLVSSAAGVRGASSEVPYFTDNGYGNPVSSLQHPAGEHHAGVTSAPTISG